MIPPVGRFVETREPAVNALPDRSLRRCLACEREFVAFVAGEPCVRCGSTDSIDISRLFVPGA